MRPGVTAQIRKARLSCMTLRSKLRRKLFLSALLKTCTLPPSAGAALPQSQRSPWLTAADGRQETTRLLARKAFAFSGVFGTHFGEQNV